MVRPPLAGADARSRLGELSAASFPAKAGIHRRDCRQLQKAKSPGFPLSPGMTAIQTFMRAQRNSDVILCMIRNLYFSGMRSP